MEGNRTSSAPSTAMSIASISSSVARGIPSWRASSSVLIEVGTPVLQPRAVSQKHSWEGEGVGERGVECRYIVRPSAATLAASSRTKLSAARPEPRPTRSPSETSSEASLPIWASCSGVAVAAERVTPEGVAAMAGGLCAACQWAGAAPPALALARRPARSISIPTFRNRSIDLS